MSSLFDPSNPKAEQQLQQLVADLPSMAKGTAKRQQRQAQEKTYERFCPVCSKLYGRTKIYAPAALKEGKCEECRAALVDGYTALVTIGRRYALVKLSKWLRKVLVNLAAEPKLDLSDDDREFLKKFAAFPSGEVVTVTEDEMDAALSFAEKKA